VEPEGKKGMCTESVLALVLGSGAGCGWCCQWQESLMRMLASGSQETSGGPSRGLHGTAEILLGERRLLDISKQGRMKMNSKRCT
jgi:hypothetical protein